MRLGVATQRSIDRAYGTLSYLDALPCGEYASLSGLGHLSYAEHPPAFESAALRFLQLEKS